MDKLSPERRSEIMRGIGRENTAPELVVRKTLHRLGFRFRIHRKDLPGSPDVVLPKHRTCVFVHGCFWHGCPTCYRGARVPKSNREYWLNKVKKNRARDERSTSALVAAGWRVVVAWECQTGDPERLANFLLTQLSPDRG